MNLKNTEKLNCKKITEINLQTEMWIKCPIFFEKNSKAEI